MRIISLFSILCLLHGEQVCHSLAGYPDCDHRLAAAVAALVQATDKSQVPLLLQPEELVVRTSPTTFYQTSFVNFLTTTPTRPPRVS